MRAVTIEYNSDPQALGPHATHLDLDRWARNLKLAAEERFGVRGILLKQSQAKPLDSSDPDVAAWLISTTAGDGWLAYLEVDDGPVTERMPTV